MYRIGVGAAIWIMLLAVVRAFIGQPPLFDSKGWWFIAIDVCYRVSMIIVVKQSFVSPEWGKRFGIVGGNVIFALGLLIATHPGIVELRFVVPLGVTCNLVVICSNGFKMPIIFGNNAWCISQDDEDFYELAHQNTRFRWLADRVPDKGGLPNRVLSLGDMVMYSGYLVAAFRVTFFF